MVGFRLRYFFFFLIYNSESTIRILKVLDGSGLSAIVHISLGLFCDLIKMCTFLYMK